MMASCRFIRDNEGIKTEYCKIPKISPSMYTLNAKNPLFNCPLEYKPPGPYTWKVPPNTT